MDGGVMMSRNGVPEAEYYFPELFEAVPLKQILIHLLEKSRVFCDAVHNCRGNGSSGLWVAALERAGSGRSPVGKSRIGRGVTILLWMALLPVGARAMGFFGEEGERGGGRRAGAGQWEARESNRDESRPGLRIAAGKLPSSSAG